MITWKIRMRTTDDLILFDPVRVEWTQQAKSVHVCFWIKDVVDHTLEISSEMEEEEKNFLN